MQTVCWILQMPQEPEVVHSSHTCEKEPAFLRHAHQHLAHECVELDGTLGGLLVVSAYQPPQIKLLQAAINVVFDAHRRINIAGDLSCYHSDVLDIAAA